MRTALLVALAACHDPALGTKQDPPYIATDATAVPTGTETTPPEVDADGDGAPAEVDCDDADPERSPDALEWCDGVDQDCDGLVDDGVPTDGAGCQDPGPPVDDGVVDLVTVSVRTDDGPNDGTDAPNPTLCLADGACWSLALADWNDREVGVTDVYAFDAGGRPVADFDRFELTESDGADAWRPAGFEVALDGALVHCEDAPGIVVGDSGAEVSAWTDPAGLHLDCDTVADSLLTHGPLVSLGSAPDQVHLWVRTSATRRVAVYVGQSTAELDASRPVAVGYPRAEDDFTWEAHLQGLTPGQTWFYAFDVDGTRLGPWSWTAPPPAGEPGARKFAFGSCSHDDLQPAFGAILAYHPDLFLFDGDNHYGNTSDLGSLRQYYRWAHERYGRDALLHAVPVLATWDDHDFVGNNTFGDDGDRDVALQGFDEYWANPSVGLPETPGVFHQTSWGDVDWFVLDDRYYRTLGVTMLGDDQLAWLLDALSASTATFKLVASGSEWSAAGSDDSWAAFPDDRAELFQGLVDRGVGGVVLLSGDIHRSELRRIAGPSGGYDLPELISSPLALLDPSTCPALGGELLACYDGGSSFVTMDVDTTAADPTIEVHIRDVVGTIVASWSFARSELEPGLIP